MAWAERRRAMGPEEILQRFAGKEIPIEFEVDPSPRLLDLLFIQCPQGILLKLLFGASTCYKKVLMGL